MAGRYDSEAFGINLFREAARKEAFDAEKVAESFRRRPATGWAIPEAYMALLLAAAGADGHLGEEERYWLLWICRRSRVLSHLSTEALAAANESVIQRHRNGENVLQDAADSLPGDLVPPVFAHCCQLALADSELQPAESRFLQELARALKIPEADATKILEVMLIAAS